MEDVFSRVIRSVCQEVISKMLSVIAKCLITVAKSNPFVIFVKPLKLRLNKETSSILLAVLMYVVT